MAKVLIILEDQMKDGAEAVNMSMQTDRQGLPKEAPPTDAMMAALTIARLWNSRSLGNMVGLVAADAIHRRNQVMQQLQRGVVDAKNPAPVDLPPDKAANEEVPEGAAEKVTELKAAIAKARAEATEAPPADDAAPAA